MWLISASEMAGAMDSQNEEKRFVQCSRHGQQRETYVCQHIVRSVQDQVPCGFLADEPTEDDPFPDAWCYECEQRRMVDGEWNDENEAFAGIMLICAGCYQRAKKLNQVMT
jgi:hypothetical protein